MISDAEVAAFQRDGCVVVRGLFADWVEVMAAGVARNMAEPGPFASENAVTEGRFFDDYCNWQRIPEFERVVRDSPAAELAARAMRSGRAQFFHDHVLVKEPGTPKPTPWHADAPYYFVEGAQTVSLWIPLDPVTEASLRFIAGSHRWPRLIRPVRWANDSDFYELRRLDPGARPRRRSGREPGAGMADAAGRCGAVRLPHRAWRARQHRHDPAAGAVAALRRRRCALCRTAGTHLAAVPRPRHAPGRTAARGLVPGGLVRLMGWVAFFLLLAVLAALPIWVERRRIAVGEGLRRTAPGGLADLTGGITHYRWHGPPGGPVVVLIHGLTTSSYVWDGLLRELTAAGMRCLTYDLFGRGLSDRPPTPQTRSFFVRQLRELLQDQGIDGEVMLIGYSMGGSIATVFAAEEPERVERLVLLAPAGLVHNPPPFAEFCRRVPYLGDWVMTLFGGWEARRQLDPAQASSVADIAARQAAETRTQGYLRSVLSSRRHLLADRLDEEHAEIRRMFVPTLAIWGEVDTAIPARALGELARVNRDARQVVIPGAGHGLVHTHPREVAEAIRGFIAET